MNNEEVSSILDLDDGNPLHENISIQNNILSFHHFDCINFSINVTNNGTYSIVYSPENDICFRKIKSANIHTSVKDIKQLEFTNCNIDAFYCDYDVGIVAILMTLSTFNYWVMSENFKEIKVSKPIKVSGEIKEIDIRATHFSENVEFNLNNKSGSCNINFQWSHFDKKLKIRNIDNFNTNEDAQKNKAVVEQLNIIDCTCGRDAYIRIGYLSVKDFKLSNLRNPENSELNIGDCHFEKFQLSNFRNMGKFKLYNINILENEYKTNIANNEIFQIDNTSIGNSDFQSLYLTSFNKVVMFDNIFANVLYSNVKWTKDIEVDECGKSDTTIMANKRDSYRTLKNVALANRDQQEALSFYSKEMEEHKKIIDKNNKWYNIDRVMLFFNYHTNNFGLNWWRPLWLILVIALFFYVIFSLILIIDNNFYLDFDIPKSILNYFYIINPIQNIEIVHKEYCNILISKLCCSLIYILLFIFRLIEGLLLYQAVQAFRKYTRKL